MARKLILLCFLTCLAGWTSVYARHITGGEMFYEFLGNSDGAFTYRVTLKLYRDCNSSGIQLDNAVIFGVYTNGPSSTLFTAPRVNLGTVEVQQLSAPGPCITNPPVVCYEIGYYTTTVSLPASQEGYTIAFQRCCRVGGIENVLNSESIGVTYLTTIPGTGFLSSAPSNSSPRFTGKDTVAICANTYFEYDFSAIDPDTSDSLSYEFCEAYMGDPNNPRGQGQGNTTPIPPPYTSVPYSPGYAGGNPMGLTVTVNRNTGLVSGIAPTAGIYVLTVCVTEYRNRVPINKHRKDLQVAVAGCITTAAVLEPEYVLCDSFSFAPRNKNISILINSERWIFGSPSSPNNIQETRSPQFTFPDTGIYTITLITNPGQECSDTSTSLVRVFPGFNPGFNIQVSCVNLPVQFTDLTTARYGEVNFHRWDFGDPSSPFNNSNQQNPSYVYTTTGIRNVSLIVGTSKGCRDTLTQSLTILTKPPLSLPNDTLICDIDTLLLTASGLGNITWSPNYNISSGSGSSVLVSPDRPTMYYANLITAPGCENTDSVFVDVRSFVTLNAGRDTTICSTDPIVFRPQSDALQYEWQPANLFSNPFLKNPTAFPNTNTTFTVTGRIGKCFASDQITVRTVDYPVVNAGRDHQICFDSTAVLEGSTNGSRFSWSPVSTLRNANTLRPIAQPNTSTFYILTAFDTLGCPKPSRDTTLVFVFPEVEAFAGNDTLIVRNQPLQLSASGGESFEWSPNFGLNNPFNSSPIASLTNDQQYQVKVTTTNGCYAFDTIQIKVFQTSPDIFVPNGFTPNGDGHNELLKAIPVGIRRFDYFRVFNRWGQLVFSTQDPSRGWDGKINGIYQEGSAFVWMAAGTDFLGNPIQRKGTVVLVR